MNKTTVCGINNCVGCRACVNACAKNAIKILDDGFTLNAVIDDTLCVNCGKCKAVCQQENEIAYNHPISWLQGWSNDPNIREKASSGGFATTLAHYYLDNGNSVFSCKLSDGEFVYKKIVDREDFNNCIGSKYVKSNTGEVYKEIELELKNKNKVLFIGLPCHIQGLKMFLGEKLSEDLLTVDLICHGTPSAELYKKYLREKGIEISDIKKIDFRGKIKQNFYPEANKYQYWTSPFLQALTYTENCYQCKFVKTDRVADITIGDSWGTSFSYEEKDKGISLVICNTEKGVQIIENLDFYLEKADAEKAVESNRQLEHSADVPIMRGRFKKVLTKTDKYHKAVKSCYKKFIFRNCIKNSFIGKFIKKFLMKNTYQPGILFFERYNFKK